MLSIMDRCWRRKVFLALSFLSSCSWAQSTTMATYSEISSNSTMIINMTTMVSAGNTSTSSDNSGTAMTVGIVPTSSTGIASATSKTDASAMITFNVSTNASASTEMTSSQTQVAPSVSEVGMSSSTPDVASPTFALDHTTEKQGDKERNLAAIIGGVVGGVVFIIIIVAVVILAVRLSKTDGAVQKYGDERRYVKKSTNNVSKKHRSAILSIRHHLPLFSTPFDASDSADPNDAAVVVPENTDVDAMIMEYRPQSQFADQIRVNLEVDDEGQGTVENGFAPPASNSNDKEHLVDGIQEGRFGILGPSTFAAQKSESDRNDVDNDDDVDSNDDKNPNIHEDYAKVTKRSQPGDSAFDNTIYGPINGVDNVGEEETHVTDEIASVESRTIENSKPGDLDMENKALNGYHAETLPPSGAAAVDRESAMYAEIPPKTAQE